MSNTFCPALPINGAHVYFAYFDLRTLTSVIVCQQCGDQQEILPNKQAQINPGQLPGNLGGLSGGNAGSSGSGLL